MMLKRYLRTALILLIVGTFVSASQSALSRPVCPEDEGSAENCFAEPGMLDLSEMTVVSSVFSTVAAADTLETYEIELEDEGKKGVNYKAIVGLAIAAAFIGYALYIMLVPDEEEEPEDIPGKEPPVAVITIPFGW
jgi:hypothetical protein